MERLRITARPIKNGSMYAIEYFYKDVLIAFSAGIGNIFNWHKKPSAKQFPELNHLFTSKP